MNELAKLIPEQIEEIRDSLLVSLTQADINALCDLALSALSGGGVRVPEGMVMVPRVPTHEMVDAGRSAMELQDPARVSHARVLWLWNDMLAAADHAHSSPASNSGSTGFQGEWIPVRMNRGKG